MDDDANDRLAEKLLVARILHGDTEAFRSVIDRTQGLVTQIIFKMVVNSEDRRDIAQRPGHRARHVAGAAPSRAGGGRIGGTGRKRTLDLRGSAASPASPRGAGNDRH